MVVSSIPQDYTKRLMVFGGRASMELAAKIANQLDLDLGHVKLQTFSDGEVYCRYEESIRGADVFLVQSTAANEAHGMTPNDALMELLVMIDAAGPRGVGRRQELHQRVVGSSVRFVGGRRLDQEYIGAADGLLVAAVDLAVGEGAEA